MHERKIACFCFLMLLPIVSAADSPPTAKKPNIVYIMADDMGYADAGFMGGQEIQTPHLDRLAKSGAVLESLYVQPVCSPTRSCLMTGRYVAHTGMYTIVRPQAKWGLPLEERTLAVALREAGYTTAIVGKWHLGEFEEAYRPTRRGFDHQYGNWFGAIDYFTHQRDGILDWHRDDQPSHDEGYSTALVGKEASRLIKEQPADKPLFLYVPFNAVHTPLQVPERYLAPYAKLTGQRRTYAGMLAAMDEAIGQIVAALEEKKLLDNTLIAFSSDNGGFGPGRVTDNGPLRAGKGTIYEGGIRACAFATWPGKIPAGRIKEPLHIVDWYPTLIKQAGGSLEQKLPLDGHDLWPVLTVGAKSPHDTLLLCGTVPKRVAIRRGDWKLLLNASAVGSEEEPAKGKAKGQGRGKKKGAATSSEPELYNLAEDLGEKENLATKEPAKAAELLAKLAEWQKGFVPPASTRAE
jgi:arylsulfatase A-like enzyme